VWFVCFVTCVKKSKCWTHHRITMVWCQCLSTCVMSWNLTSVCLANSLRNSKLSSEQTLLALLLYIKCLREGEREMCRFRRILQSCLNNAVIVAFGEWKNVCCSPDETCEKWRLWLAMRRGPVFVCGVFLLHLVSCGCAEGGLWEVGGGAVLCVNWLNIYGEIHVDARIALFALKWSFFFF
jgi:hypothetical protein